MRKTFALIISIAIIQFSSGQDKPMTTAERTNYKATSTYDEVMSFIDKLQKHSEYVRLETIATTIGSL